jgi:hypothetical protein
MPWAKTKRNDPRNDINVAVRKETRARHSVSNRRPADYPSGCEKGVAPLRRNPLMSFAREG